LVLFGFEKGSNALDFDLIGLDDSKKIVPEQDILMLKKVENKE
jgi:hypothetical protein